MKVWWFIFLLLSLLCGVAGAVLLQPEPAGWHGIDHAQFAPMQQSPGAARHHGWLLTGWAFGVLQITFFTTTLTLGLRKGKGVWLVAILGGVMVVLFSLVLVLYRGEMGTDSEQLVLGLPPSTAMMLYVFWPAPIGLIAVYVCMFDRWILSNDDLDQFTVLVKSRQSSATNVDSR